MCKLFYAYGGKTLMPHNEVHQDNDVNNCIVNAQVYTTFHQHFASDVTKNQCLFHV